MSIEQSVIDSFDPNTLRSLTDAELAEIHRACDDFNRTFNEGLDEPYRYTFTAVPANFSDMDFDFYELGGRNWYRDNGYGFTCAWGTILVESFGFEWAAMKTAQSLRDWVLRHEEAFYVLFPWQTLWNIVESTGYQFEKAQGAWIRILEHVDMFALPDGWHPAADAIAGLDTMIPQDVVAELKKLYANSDYFYSQLGLEPYEWDAKTDWNVVSSWIRCLERA